MDRLVKVSVPTMLNPKGGVFRRYYAFNGQLGSLFANFHDAIAKPLGADFIHSVDDNAIDIIYDNRTNNWVEFTAKLMDKIPPTFTYAPKPTTLEMELDYFVRAAGLIKHSFIWSVDAIPRDCFANVCSQNNAKFRGRYTLTPWLPQIDTLGKMDVNGMYIISENDRAKIYNSGN